MHKTRTTYSKRSSKKTTKSLHWQVAQQFKIIVPQRKTVMNLWISLFSVQIQSKTSWLGLTVWRVKFWVPFGRTKRSILWTEQEKDRPGWAAVLICFSWNATCDTELPSSWILHRATISFPCYISWSPHLLNSVPCC